mgnify:CR=1 FL=1
MKLKLKNNDRLSSCMTQFHGHEYCNFWDYDSSLQMTNQEQQKACNDTWEYGNSYDRNSTKIRYNCKVKNKIHN